jgi:beta-1,4-N-acetylglucosaminyltransferase
MKDYSIIVLPRARRVHQPIFTTPPTALKSLVHALYYFTYLPFMRVDTFVDVLLLNGPGTCFILCVASYVSKVKLLNSTGTQGNRLMRDR